MCDGWTGNDTHFVSVFSSYWVERQRRLNFASTVSRIPQIAVLALSPLSNVYEEHADVRQTLAESESFNAKAHLKFFRETFDVNGVNIH